MSPVDAGAFFAGKKVLVTGASGFLGGHLCGRLQACGAEVHAVSRSPRSPGEGLTWWQCDLTDCQELRRLYASIQPSIIYHLTGHGVGSPDLELVLPTFHNDLQTLVNMLTVATELGCDRLITTASLEEPQEGVAPASPYAAAKTAGMVYARLFHRIYGAPLVVLRPMMTYGPGQKEHKLIPYVILSLLKGAPPKLSSGTRAVDWVYVDDVTEGFLAAAHRAEPDPTPIDLGAGTLVPIRDVVHELTALIGNGVEPLFGSLADRPQESIRAADSLAARERLDWTAKTALREGLAQTIAWYRRQLESSPARR